MAWLEIHQSLPGHRKTMEASGLLDDEEAHIVGHLACLWLWSIDNAPEGDVTHISDIVLAKAAHWHGDATEFVNALTTAGFIERDELGRRIHDYREYIGRLIERRRQDAERKRTARAVREMSDGDPADIAKMSSVTQHNSTVPNQEQLTRDASETEREVLAILRSVMSYPFDFARDLVHIRALSVDYPRCDLLEQAKKWATYKMDKPLAANSNPRSQFRTWVQKSEKWAEKGERRRTPRVVPAPDNRAMDEWVRSQNDAMAARESPGGGGRDA